MNWLDSILESVALFFVELSGSKFDPDGCQLPSFSAPSRPAAKVPKKEVKADTGGDWVGWDGGKLHSEGSKAITDNYEDYGLTEREYGEMREYDPPLRNLDLASRIKRKKADGLTLKEIARDLKRDEQTVKHYSSALYRASK